MKIKDNFRKIILTAILLLTGFSVSADEISVRIEMIESRNYPKVEAVINVEDGKGEPVTTLSKANVKARVDQDEPVGTIMLDRFAWTDRPTNFYIMMTNNGLTAGRPLAVQKEAIRRIVDSMGVKDKIFIYTMGLEPLPVIEGSTKEDFKDNNSLLEEIDVSEDQTKIYDCLVGISRIVKNKQEENSASKSRSVIIILTDGRDQESRNSSSDVITEFSDSGLAVYAIGFKLLGAQKLSVIDSLTSSTGGYYSYAGDIMDMPDAMDAIYKKVSNAYLLSFKVKGVPADDSKHDLIIDVTDRDLTDTAYKGFIAVKNPVPLWLKILLIILLILVVAAFIVLTILSRRKERRAMGIVKRRCEDCGRRMRDDWDFCPFCRYLKNDKKRKKKKKKKKDKDK